MSIDVTSPPITYGMHLMLRLGEIDRTDHLDNPMSIEAFLECLVARIGMRILDGPRVKTEGGDRLRYGHSGVVILYESHAAIHTYPRLRSAFLDVFSCKEFSIDDLLTAVREFFGTFVIIESAILDRGHHWSEDVTAELEQWNGRR